MTPAKVLPVTVATHPPLRSPFEMAIVGKKYLPNPVTSWCTIELKIHTTRRWLVAEYGWRRWLNIVGFRADEMHRVLRAAIRNAAKKERFRTTCPLAKARLTKAGHVLPFWRAQPFDLGLAGAWEGNCDGCFKKKRSAIVRMFQDHPERMAWWPAIEGDLGRELGVSVGTFDPTTALFRADRENYASIAEWTRRNPMFPAVLDPEDGGFDVLADCEPWPTTSPSLKRSTPRCR